MIITRKMYQEMYEALQQSSAIYCLLHMHAAGQTDFTEDQLANVVRDVSLRAERTLRKARGEREAA